MANRINRLRVVRSDELGPVRQFDELDGSRCRSTSSFLREIGHALRFPPYYGANWDALDECIHDLDWLPSGGVVLVIRHSSELLVDEPSERLTTLTDILRSDLGVERPLTIAVDGSDERIDRALELPSGSRV